VVARIAPEPINTNVAVSGFRTHADAADVRTPQTAAVSPPLPPVLEPVPTPVPAPVIVPLNQAFAAALVVEQMQPPSVTPAEFRVRGNTGWQVPDSSLRLTDRRI
jgi:hypothetical protein